jgi:enolase-phosphatase E1
VTIALGERGIRGVVLDIEGTTTPMWFVYDVLFPYARSHLRAYVEAHIEKDELRDVVRLLGEEHAADVASGETPPDLREAPSKASAGSLAAYLEWLMDRDRKSPGLKLIQGRIWERGYADGSLHSEVFADVPPALGRWRNEAIDIAIYSSGSVLAQRLIFAHATAGDLTQLISFFFDTSVGPKRSADSYRRIVERMGRPAERILFVSDVVEELDAARAAGLSTALCVRPGNAPQPPSSDAVIRSFDEISA